MEKFLIINRDPAMDDDLVQQDGDGRFPRLENCNAHSDFYEWNKDVIRGQGAIIKLDPSFSEDKIKRAVEENLELDVQVYDAEKVKKSGIRKVVKEGKSRFKKIS